MSRALTVALAALSAASLVGQFRMPLNGDSAYVLDVARRMLGGAALYRDIIDVNPPVVFWASLPIAGLGGDGPGAMLLYRVAVVVTMLAVLGIAWPFITRAPATRAGFLLFALVLPAGYFGQREHLMFALTFPYIALAAWRASGGVPGTTVAVVAGVIAAAGISLKPPAVVIPLLLVLQQAVWARSIRPVRHPEHFAAAAGLGLIALASLAFAPGYLEVVRTVAGPYGDFNRQPLGTLLARDVHMWAGWFALALGLGFAGRLAGARRLRLHLLVIVGFFASAVMQGKGFGYHYFPVVGWSGIALLELLFGTSAGERPVVVPRLLAALALLPILYLFGAVTWRRAGGVYTRSRHEQSVVDDLVGSLPVRLAVLSARIGDAYPVVNERGHHVVLGYPQFWVAALPLDREGTASIRRRYGEDLERGRPDAVVVRAPAPEARNTGDLAVNYLEYLCHDAVARRALNQYRLAARAGGFDLYRLDANGPPACASS